MKKLILLLSFIIVSFVANSQVCYDPCQYKSYFMHNSDTTKWLSFEMYNQGLLVQAQNNVNSSGGKFQIDATSGFFSMESSYPTGQNYMAGNNLGIEIGTSKPLLLSSADVVTLRAGNYSITIKEVAGKTIIKSPAIPTTCTGQTSGTWANIGGFLKVCP